MDLRSPAPGLLLGRPPAPEPAEVPSTFLAPADWFPTALAELELVELHVLHSRICRQLEQEYRTEPAGPHPVTLDRCQELVAELDTRQCFLAGPPPAARPEAPAAVPPDRDEQQPEEPRLGTLFRRRSGDARGPELEVGDPGRLRPGEQVEAWRHGQLHGVGSVEEAAPALGVVWIREALDGYRRMIQLEDTVLRYHLPCSARRRP